MVRAIDTGTLQLVPSYHKPECRLILLLENINIYILKMLSHDQSLSLKQPDGPSCSAVSKMVSGTVVIGGRLVVRDLGRSYSEARHISMITSAA